jgi:hypothetical protein
MHSFTRDPTPDRNAIMARFARMPDAKLRSTLDAARELMCWSKRETWRVQVELAEAELRRRLLSK